MIPLALLLGCLAQDATEDPLRGLWKPVDLDLKDTPGLEAFDLLFARAGSRVELPKLANHNISLRIEGAPFWKAFDQLCRAHGGLRIPARPFHGRRGPVEAGPWIDVPVVYRGPLRFHVVDVGRVREAIYPGRLDRTDLTLMLSWTPELTPVLDDQRRPVRPRLTRAEDDRGTVLLPEWKDIVEYDYSASGTLDSGSVWLLRFGPAAAGAKAIKTLEGVWEGAFLGEIDDLRFANPAEEVGTTLRAGHVLVTLTRFHGRADSNDDLSYEIHLKLGVDPEAPAEWREGLRRVPLESRILPRATCGPLPPGPSAGNVHLFAQKGSDAELRGWFRGTPGPLTIRVGRDPRVVKVPFAFENVRLPEEKP